jgi:hypothetical protein
MRRSQKNMNNEEVYSFALKNTLQEIQNICPDVSNTFIFKDGELVAQDETTSKKTVNQTIDAFTDITEKSSILGDLNAVTIQGTNGQANIACMNDFYLTTISSKEADEKYVNTLTRILVPTVIRLVEKIHPAQSGDETLTTVPEPEPEEDEVAEDEDVEDEVAEEPAEQTEDEKEENEMPEEETATTEDEEEQEEPFEEPEVDTEPLLPEPPVTQLIVENLGGLLVPSDTVRFDQEVISHWNELYGDKKINEVEVEALSGKTTRCKFKHIKKSKDTGKGIIKMPEKIQLTLETSEGALVTVKPVVE